MTRRGRPGAGKVMQKRAAGAVWLDYAAEGRRPKFLPNLSALAVAGDYLWTASDEMRSIECLGPLGAGYRLKRKFDLDSLFPGLPGKEEGREADIEALDVAEGRLWLCGSHALTRRGQGKMGRDRVDPKIRKRLSRRLLGSVPLKENGAALAMPGHALPFEGPGSLRDLVRSDPYLAPFMALPSKENGFDIEGLTVFRRKLYLGLRGPVVDSMAIILSMSIATHGSLRPTAPARHFLDLGGGGVRDLTRWKDGILILAGPVTSSDAPFALFHWTPQRTPKIQKPRHVRDFPAGLDHPEGICGLRRQNRDGLIVVYDTRERTRTTGTRYRADWFGLASSSRAERT
jgi:Protein of unknown function (DUF3616)